jgi:hypothetical protein
MLLLRGILLSLSLSFSHSITCMISNSGFVLGFFLEFCELSEIRVSNQLGAM